MTYIYILDLLPSTTLAYFEEECDGGGHEGLWEVHDGQPGGRDSEVGSDDINLLAEKEPHQASPAGPCPGLLHPVPVVLALHQPVGQVGEARDLLHDVHDKALVPFRRDSQERLRLQMKYSWTA